MKTNNLKGFTLVETIFYLSFLIVFLGIVVSFVISLSKSYRTIQSTKSLESSAIFSLERITREIRNSVSVRVEESVFGVDNGVLSLDTIDSSGDPEIIKFYLDANKTVYVDSNSAQIGPLTLSGVKVESMKFYYATSTNSEAIKLDMVLESNSGSVTSTRRDFHSTVVLRGSYK